MNITPSWRALVLFMWFALPSYSQAATAPGLKLTLAPAGQQVADSRVSRLPALVVRQGESASPFLDPGPFTATWSGQLKLPLRNRYRFHVEGTGRLQLTINGATILDGGTNTTSDWIRLQKGGNSFEAVYNAPATGDAVTRLLWSSADHPAESIPPMRWVHDDADPALTHGLAMRRGRAVFADRQCLRCHSGADEDLRLFLLDSRKRHGVALRTVQGMSLGVVTNKDRVTAVAVTGDGAPAIDGERTLFLHVPAHRTATKVRVFYFTGPESGLPAFAGMVKERTPDNDLDTLTGGGPLRWGDPLVTRGHVSTRNAPLVIDTLTMPCNNPWNALMFAGGHDFFSDGRAAVCTMHGDVWIVDGIDDTLTRVTWKRFATGLYQPLGLKIIDDRIHVGCRDQIVIPEDRNGDGEADFYRNFSSLVHINGGGHSFHTCLETDPEGNFYFLKCANGGSEHGGTLLKVSPDGRKLEIVATGFRNPNGLGMSPTGLVTEADQQGNWVPETRLDIIEPGGFYGFMPMHHRTVEPKIYDGPTCWIPRPLDNSAGGQVWVDNPAWGPLDKQLIHISWGRCTTMMVLTDRIDGTWQGGVVPLPGQFLSGIHRGRHNPADGHLYLTGCDGWQTAAVRDGCFQRLRKTDRPFYLPIGLQVHQNGIRVTFSQALDPKTAGDPSAYAVERWNYRWTSKYGSADWSVDDPERQARDPVTVTGIDLSDDGRSVFLHLRDLKPVMQMRLEYNIDAADGTLMRGELPFTIQKLRPYLPVEALD